MGKLNILMMNDILKEFEGNTVIQYDILKYIASFQGFMNKKSPSFHMIFEEDMDTFWLEYNTKEGKFLHGSEKVYFHTFADFLVAFKEDLINLGIVLWDSEVPATVNVATTICGVTGALPVRFDTNESSLMKILANYDIRIKRDLTGMFTGKGNIPGSNRPSTGSAKNDSYIWALQNYFDKCSDMIIGCVLDARPWNTDNPSEPEYPDLGNAVVPNTDYFVYRSAFVFDLSPWNDEKPCDDLNQPMGTDYNTLNEIFMAMYNKTGGKIATLSGFVPWHQKYTEHLGRGKHGGVDSEWKLVEIATAYNLIHDADAYGFCGLANASLYAQFPLKEQYKNNRPAKQIEYDPNKKYILFYMGDFDAAPWLTRFSYKLLNDPVIGKNPLMWCFNANLSDRIPCVFDYIYEQKGENDYIETGDSGAGYLNPTLLYEPREYSNLPDGSEAWIEHNKKYLSKFDMEMVGFIINGRFPLDDRIYEDYSKFIKVGAGHNSYGSEPVLKNDTLFVPHTKDVGLLDVDPKEIADAVFDSSRDDKQFYIYRTVLVTPTQIDNAMNILKEKDNNYELIDPYNFFRLYKEQLSK